MKKNILITLLLIITPFLFSQTDDIQLSEGLYAKFSTDQGNFIVELDMGTSALSSSVFVALTEGTIDVVDDTPYYSNLDFYRIIEEYAVFSGDPLNNGQGSSSISYPQQPNSELSLSQKGIMAFQGYPGITKAGSFFITIMGDSYLDQVYSPFGRVIQGMDVLESLTTDNSINEIEILRLGEEAENFNCSTEKIDQLISQAKENQLEYLSQENPQLASILMDLEGYQQSDSGIFYKVFYEGVGDKPYVGSLVSVHYTGMLLDKTVFDSSIQQGTPFEITLGTDPIISGWVETLMDMRVGEGRLVIIPPELAYGDRAVGDVIPANSWLIFEIQMLGIE